MKSRFSRALVFAFLITFIGSVAAAAEWQLGRVTGQGWIVEKGIKPAAMRGGVAVPRASTVTTAAGVRAMLLRGQANGRASPTTSAAGTKVPEKAAGVTGSSI